MDIKDIITQCEFNTLGTCRAADLELREEVREMCNVDKCNNFNRSWACPPGCGSLEKFRTLIASHSSCFVFQTVKALEDDFDIEGMLEAGKLHKERLETLRQRLSLAAKDALKSGESVPTILGSGTCTVCETCTYPSDPCRFPSRQMVSMEAAGLVVSEVCELAGIPYNHGKGTISFTSCILC